MNDTKIVKRFLYTVDDVLMSVHWIILITMIFAMAAFVASKLSYKPSYVVTSTYSVKSRQSSSSAYTGLVAAENLADTFDIVVRSNELARVIMEKNSWDSLPGTISTRRINETNIIELKTTAGSPRDAFVLMQSVCDSYPVIINQIEDNAVFTELSKPHIPVVPVNSANEKSNAVKYGIVGLAISCFIFTYISLSRDVLNTPSQLKERINSVLIESLPLEGPNGIISNIFTRRFSSKSSVVMLNSSSNTYLESIVNIRSKLVSKAGGKPISIVISSSLANEGKSTVAAAIAVVLSKLGKKVAVIDLDMYNSSQYKYFSKYTNGLNSLGNYLYSSDYDITKDVNVDPETGIMLFYGKAAGKSRKTFPVQPAADLIAELKKIADFIIVDTPPITIFSDASEICDAADYSVLVVREHYATEDEISSSISVLDDSGAQFLGCIYNGERFMQRGSSTGYGYGYGYGKYGNYGNNYGRNGDAEDPADESEGGEK